MPVTVPLMLPTVATDGAPDMLQVPPGVGSPSEVVEPAQTPRRPVIAGGSELTFTLCVTVPVHPCAFVAVRVTVCRPVTE